MIALAPWPNFDPALAEDDEKVLPVQINGKRRGEVRAPAGASDAEVRRIVLGDPDHRPPPRGADRAQDDRGPGPDRQSGDRLGYGAPAAGIPRPPGPGRRRLGRLRVHAALRHAWSLLRAVVHRGGGSGGAGGLSAARGARRRPGARQGRRPGLAPRPGGRSDPRPRGLRPRRRGRALRAGGEREIHPHRNRLGPHRPHRPGRVSQVSYDAADAPYAGIAARQDSQQRAAADAARKIQLDLAAWMASRARTALEPAAPAG